MAIILLLYLSTFILHKHISTISTQWSILALQNTFPIYLSSVINKYLHDVSQLLVCLIYLINFSLKLSLYAVHENERICVEGVSHFKWSAIITSRDLLNFCLIGTGTVNTFKKYNT
jgi:hypothetical protein